MGRGGVGSRMWLTFICASQNIYTYIVSFRSGAMKWEGEVTHTQKLPYFCNCIQSPSNLVWIKKGSCSKSLHT